MSFSLSLHLWCLPSCLSLLLLLALSFLFCHSDSSFAAIGIHLHICCVCLLVFLFLTVTLSAQATADIVILYDSDWNPQVDLQAIDRAHRIGQKKPVQVFRFLAEGTIEEKIIERADRKLFLDAAVIQQGRLAEKHTSLEKDELMKMVRFGADQIISGKGGTYTDEDIDALIAKGEQRTSDIQAKLQTDAQHNLANFTLLAEDETGRDTFSFEGKNYRDANTGPGNFINLPQRQRKRNYDVNEYFRDAMNAAKNAAPSTSTKKASAPTIIPVESAPKRRKGPAFLDFQLFDKEKLEELVKLEGDLEEQRYETRKTIRELRIKAASATKSASDHGPDERLALAEKMEQELTRLEFGKENEAKKLELLAEGFADWSRKDFRCFAQSLEKHGRWRLDAIVQDMQNETTKEAAEVKRYFVAFWTHYDRIGDGKKIVDRVERGEKKVHRMRQIRDAIQEKVERHLEDVFGSYYWDRKEGKERRKDIPSATELLHYSWPKMRINYVGSKCNWSYQEDEDAFLVYMMHRHGYGASERMRMEIRRAVHFRFNWFFKSRSTAEIQKRCDTLVKIVEKENEEVHRKEEELRRKKENEAAAAAAAAAAVKAEAKKADKEETVDDDGKDDETKDEKEATDKEKDEASPMDVDSPEADDNAEESEAGEMEAETPAATDDDEVDD